MSKTIADGVSAAERALKAWKDALFADRLAEARRARKRLTEALDDAERAFVAAATEDD